MHKHIVFIVEEFKREYRVHNPKVGFPKNSSIFNMNTIAYTL